MMKYSMKKIVFFLVLCFSVVNLYCQTGTVKQNTIEIYIAPGIGYLGGGGVAPFGIGIDYSRRLTERWSLCGGLEQIARIMGNKNSISKEQVGDEVTVNATSKSGLAFDWNITSIPIQLKYHFNNFIYINGGTSLDLYHDEPSDTIVGLGWRAGAGFEHEFNNGIMLSLNPYLKVNFGNGDSSYLQLAVNFGVGYSF